MSDPKAQFYVSFLDLNTSKIWQEDFQTAEGAIVALLLARELNKLERQGMGFWERNPASK
jgi:hypothetical protein